MINDKIKNTLKESGIVELNQMQKDAFEAIKNNREVMLLSPTGSGKTLAFLLPLLERINPNNAGIQILVLTPSRELALQIEAVFKSLGTGKKVNTCYGGHSMKTEKNNLLHPPAVLIGTPGRIADHLKNERFRVSNINTIVLDEFDKALEFGFQKDMEFIVNELHYTQNRVLVSATKADEIPEFTKIKDPVIIDHLKGDAIPQVKIIGIRARDGEDKINALFDLVCKIGNDSTLIFCNHRDAVERISKLFNDQDIAHGNFHGGMKQEHRERELIKFRNGTVKVMLATDLAARGLDIPDIESVVHYQIPIKEDAYIHRNGRTARMRANGNVYMMLGEKDFFPKYITSHTEIETLAKQENLLPRPEWTTLYLDSGKKDRINKIDIVGLFFKKGGIKKDDLGLINVMDFSCYIAVKREVAESLVAKLEKERIKKKKVKLSIAK